MARKRSRWGDAPADTDAGDASADASGEAAAATGNGENGGDSAGPSKKKRKSRFSAAPPPDTPAGNGAAAGTTFSIDVDAKKAKAAALQASIAARLAALKAKKAGSAAAGSASAAVGGGAPAPPAPAAAPAAPAAAKTAATKKAKTYEIDLSDTTPLFKKEQLAKEEASKPKKKVNPYLAHLEPAADAGKSKKDGAAKATDAAVSLPKGQDASSTLRATTADNGNDNDDGELLLDGRLRGGKVAKTRSRHRPIKFVQPGRYTAMAELKREKLKNAAEAGYASGRKAGYVPATMATAAGAGSKGGSAAYGAGEAGLAQEYTLSNLPARADAPDPSDEAARRDNTIPAVMEWWDVELIPRGELRKELADIEARHRKEEALGALGRMAPVRKGGTKGENGGGNIENETDGDTTMTDVSTNANANAQTDPRSQLEEKCYQSASSKNARTHNLVQHPVPVKPPHAPTGPPVQPTLHLTKKEMKRQRKLRRAEKQRELQDRQAAGLIPPPEPRLTLSNFMRVLGDQAVMDPSQMEQKVNEQIQARKIRHERMNEERKLTKEQRKEKRARKLAEDTTRGVSVALFLVQDMSHRYHRTKVDLNAQQNGITGGVLEVEQPKLALVIAEGGPKAIKRYTRLMTVRMKWRGENFWGDDDGEEEESDPEGGGEGAAAAHEGAVHEGDASAAAAPQKFNPHNACELIWTGMGAKRNFASFVFQKCETADVARKVLEAKGVAHFMDQVLVHASGRGSEFNFRLGGGE